MTSVRDAYLRDVAEAVRGPRSAKSRLLAELRDHIDDAVASSVADPRDAERRAVTRLGLPTEVAAAWKARCARLRRRRRRRGAALAVSLAAASVLAVAQHADGRQPPAAPVDHGGSVNRPSRLIGPAAGAYSAKLRAQRAW